MKALFAIHPTERISQFSGIVEAEFPVAEPMIFVDVPANATIDTYAYDSLTQSVVKTHGWFLGATGTYNGKKRDPDDIDIADRPDADHIYVDGAWVIDVAAGKNYIWEKIKEKRDLLIQTGGYQAAGKWFHSDTFSRTQILGLLLLGNGLPSGLQWKTMDGSFITMTPALVQQVFAAAASSDIAIFTAGEVHKAQAFASANPFTYDFSADWPPVFVG